MNKQQSPIRCFEGAAQPHEPFWTVKNVEGQDPEIELYGYISEYSWWEDEITPMMFRQALYDAGGGGPITIRINSYGGDVVAASLMHTMIKDYPGQVTVQIDGIAASAATVVAMAGDKIKIQETGYFMIHDPSVVFMLAQLNIEDLTRLASSLAAVKEGIVNAYESKTGLSRTRLSKLMTEETWMDAQRALDLGFVDEVIWGEKKALVLPANTAVVNGLTNFANVPAPIRQALEIVNAPDAAKSSSQALDDMKREAQSLRERVEQILKKED